jgi:hypothetical protein
MERAPPSASTGLPARRSLKAGRRRHSSDAASSRRIHARGPCNLQRLPDAVESPIGERAQDRGRKQELRIGSSARTRVRHQNDHEAPGIGRAGTRVTRCFCSRIVIRPRPGRGAHSRRYARPVGRPGWSAEARENECSVTARAPYAYSRSLVCCPVDLICVLRSAIRRCWIAIREKMLSGLSAGSDCLVTSSLLALV